MSTRRIHRPARATRPLPEPAEHIIEPPPNLPEGKTGSPIAQLLPMAGVMGSVVMMTVMRGSQFAVIGALVLVTALLGGAALVFSQRGKAQRTRRLQRERYLEYLEELRHDLGAEDRGSREAARLLHPLPEALYDIVDDTARLWERRRHDRDFLRIRVGTGAVPVRVLTLQAQSGTVLTPPDRFMRNEATGLRERFGATPDMPLTVPLDRAGDISVIGAREDVLRVARTLVVQAAVTHAPDDAAFALACPTERIGDWPWFKWLPHALDPDTWDGPVPARRIAGDLPELSRELSDDLGRRAAFAAELRRGLARRDALDLVQRLVVVHDGHGREATELPRPDSAVPLGDMGVTVVHLLADRTHEPDHVSVRITLGPGHDTIRVEDLRGPEPVCTEGSFDEVTAAGAEGLARMIAPLRLSPESASADAPLSGPVDFCAQLGIEDPARVDPGRMWAARRGGQSFLRVPIGLGGDHAPVLLDLKESAELGMGPHGLCVGATGSGKSELLRTLVLALVATHSPEDLAMVLVDYKGGATFAPFASLPHVAGVITNLENKAGLVERVHASLAGEVQRRQQVLKDAGNIADISTYAALRAERPDLAPLPHLFVVIDEFGELLAAKPDFIDLFLSVGRIGRSIGIHLLLSSQRIEGGKLKGLDTYLSYRLGLRTFSPEESRTVLDTADAFHLPPIPGFGYLKVDTSVYQRFKASYVSGRPAGPERRDTPRDERPAVLPYSSYNTLQEPEREDAPQQRRQPARRTAGPTLLSTIVGQLASAAPPVPRIWLPPLPGHLPLDAVDRVTAGRRGMQFAHRAATGGKAAGALRVPLGLLDDPARQWQGRWEVDLTRAGGHLAVIGGPQTGKTTLLRTLVMSLALTHTPEEVAVYGLDLVGGGLAALARLPHVGGVAGRTDRERASRTVEEVRGMLTARQDAFRDHNIDSVEHLRRLRAAGRLPALGPPDIVLVVDGFGALREDFEKLDDAVGELLKHGGGYGIHVVAGMLRWNDVRIAAQSNFGTRVELRLNDPADSGIDRRLAQTVAPDEHGRALTDGKLFAQVALPRIDSRATDTDLGDALESAVRAVRSSWSGATAPPVRVLPARLPLASLPDARTETDRVAIGLDQTAMHPVNLDLFGRDQHLIVFGDSECGKTNLLKVIARGLMERHSDQELVFAVMDPRRGLHSLVPEPYRGGYAHNSRLAAALSTAVASELDKRMPDDAAMPDAHAAGPAVLKGPRIVVLVDDYDILSSGGQHPLGAFVPYIPSAPDLGLHFVVARRVSGASRAMYEPFLTTLRESGSAALVMTGHRSEGQLFPGVYPAPRPPGRGTYISRGSANRLIQTAISPEYEDA